MPMAMPMSACFSAGASLTPSPVIATISPRFFHARTILSLSIGDTRAYTVTWSTICSNSASLMRPSSSPVSTQVAFAVDADLRGHRDRR